MKISNNDYEGIELLEHVINIKIEKMSVTITIPNISESTLERVVQSAMNQLPYVEINVVGLRESKLIAEKNSVKFLYTEVKTPNSIGINRAVRLAVNDRIIILDADAIPINRWGRNILASFEMGCEIFSGSVNTSVENRWIGEYNRI